MAYVPFLVQKIRTSAESQDAQDTQTGTALPGVRLHSFRKSRVWLWYNCSPETRFRVYPESQTKLYSNFVQYLVSNIAGPAAYVIQLTRDNLSALLGKPERYSDLSNQSRPLRSILYK